MATQTTTFHLGITMAGAVSAGAYTAGAIDYLLQALETWEKYKQDGHPQFAVPPHQVVIDVVGGGSAGGVIAALTALACKVGMEPVTDSKEAAKADFKPNNLLFNAWVNMVDVPQTNTFQQMLDTGDIREGKIPSLLNSKPIDDMADGALDAVREHWPTGKTLPPYIAEDLDVLLTLCSLKGIPIGVDFDSDNKGKQRIKPSYQMQTHKLLARFNYQQPDPAQQDEAIALDSIEALQRLIDCAKSTAAFPIGLAARHMSGFSKAYLKKQFGTFMGFTEESLEQIFNDSFEDPFNFTSIDGGTLNNEPFGEIETLLKKGSKHPVANSGIILIDPFPNFTDQKVDNEESIGRKTKAPDEDVIDSLEELIGPIFGTLRHQGMFKETDIREIIENGSKVKKNMIFPSRRIGKGKKVDGNHLACGALAGFSGFIDRRFRVHDFFLGRKNCRNFLRFYFVLDCPEGGPLPELFKDWTPEMVEQYRLPNPDKEGYFKLPIIPCFDFMEEVEEQKKKESKASISKLNWDVARERDVDFPQITAKALVDNYEGAIQNRADAILNAFTEIMQKQDKPGAAPSPQEKALDDFWRKKYPNNWWGRLWQKVAEKTIKSSAPKLMSKKALQAILKDLNKSELLKW